MNEKLIILVLALLLDVFMGDPPNILHPVAGMGVIIRSGDRMVHSERPIFQFLAGILIVLCCISVSVIVPVLLIRLLEPNNILSILCQAVLLKLVISMRRLLTTGLEVERALIEGNTNDARELVSTHLVSRPTSDLDEGHVASAVIESYAENISDSFIAPLFMYMIGGLPLAWAYRAANTADAMIGYRGGRYEYLGKFGAYLDDVLNWLPARVSALFIIVSSFLLKIVHSQSYFWKNAWQVMKAQHRKTSSPNAGFPMSAASGALQVILEKEGDYCLSGGNNLPDAGTIRKACLLIGLSGLLFVFLCVIILIILSGWY